MEFRILIISSILSIAVLIILRPVFLWYWKINTIEELLREQISLARSLKHEKENNIRDIQKVDESFITGVEFTFPSFISNVEKKLIKEKAANLRPGQLLSIDSVTFEIKFWRIEDYQEAWKESSSLMIVAIKK